MNAGSLRFWVWFGSALLLLFVLGLSGPVSAQQNQNQNQREEEEEEELEEIKLAKGPWVGELGKCRDINEEEPQLVRVDFKDANGNVRDKRKFFVSWEETNEHSGEWVVLGIWCPHLKCAVDYEENFNFYICPCCGSEFALDGRRLSGRVKKGLTNFSDEVYEEDGWLKMEVEPEIEKP